MNPYKFNVKFRLEKRANIVGEYPINADITFCGKRIFYFSGFSADPSQWNEKNQQMKRNNFTSVGISAADVNARLNKIRIAVEQTFDMMEHQAITPTPTAVRESVKKFLNEEKLIRRSIKECYTELVVERRKEIDEHPETSKWTYGNWKRHNTMLNHWSAFRPSLYFEDLSHEVLDAFERYLLSKGLSNRYVSKALVDFNTFLNWATEKGYNKNLTYRTRKQLFPDDTSADSGLFALDEKELQAIINVNTASKAITRTRDMFVFCCYTSLRYSDVIKLRWEDIFDDGIDVIMQKTRKYIRIPFNNTVREILKRYKGSCDDGRVFPKISNQKYNDQLKVLGQLAGLTGDCTKVKHCGNQSTKTPMKKWECLTSHVARRTFVTYALKIGIPPEIIRAITGHSTSKMMQTYVKLNFDAKREFMEKLDNTPSQLSEEKAPATIFELISSPDEEKAILPLLGIRNREIYLRRVEKDPILAMLHVAVVLWNRDGAIAAAPYIDRLPAPYLEQFYYLMATTRAHNPRLTQ